ncbi:metalloregulator ArsR/SmtB family transcription factor [Nocardia sp. CDC159]|uniref:Metalloregulator ArsR/SmtB family transcription factor n=1 Tax=Nocardia pulmonis TaxID=2951408 RepID=A0A9X2EEL8_9NOCA|nr:MULTISPECIES: metalloregulator ArsR/SmtB family transcription factor [Nocardia]MCM6779001.1 metalloregulator ArsR/SmtB family transcription factor [Nocardia pulmonis]MCM6791903.1 metalloregulator ArsR/SmtB family transcription factor [Nocardia sp. CDC159]
MSANTAHIFEALGDPIRRSILELVATGEQSAGAIVQTVRDRTSISQPGVSQHLKALRAAGLVRVRAEGTRRFYALDPDGVGAALAWLTTLVDPLHQLANPLDALETEIARGKRARRAAGPTGQPSYGSAQHG